MNIIIRIWLYWIVTWMYSSTFNRLWGLRHQTYEPTTAPRTRNGSNFWQALERNTPLRHFNQLWYFDWNALIYYGIPAVLTVNEKKNMFRISVTVKLNVKWRLCSTRKLVTCCTLPYPDWDKDCPPGDLWKKKFTTLI